MAAAILGFNGVDASLLFWSENIFNRKLQHENWSKNLFHERFPYSLAGYTETPVFFTNALVFKEKKPVESVGRLKLVTILEIFKKPNTGFEREYTMAHNGHFSSEIFYFSSRKFTSLPNV